MSIDLILNNGVNTPKGVVMMETMAKNRVYNFTIFVLDDSYEYKAAILSNNYLSPLDYYKDIEKDLVADKIGAGYILFDCLLSSGNGSERFITAVFNGKEFDTDSFEFIRIPKKAKERKLLPMIYRGRLPDLDNSILTSMQQKLVAAGVCI